MVCGGMYEARDFGRFRLVDNRNDVRRKGISTGKSPIQPVLVMLWCFDVDLTSLGVPFDLDSAHRGFPVCILPKGYVDRHFD